jgi:hypothetical protein
MSDSLICVSATAGGVSTHDNTPKTQEKKITVTDRNSIKDTINK